MEDSKIVKKILRSLPKEWDSRASAAMESKNLNKLDSYSLDGSLIMFIIILKTKVGRLKREERNIALKASSPIKKESLRKN